MEEFGEAPLVGVDAAAPVDGFELLGMGELGDLLGLVLGAMVAPEIVVVQRLHVGADGDDARSCGVEGDSFDGGGIDAGLRDDVAGGAGERVHLVVVGLGGLVWVLAIALEGVLGDGGAEAAMVAVEERHANAEGSKVYTGDDGHFADLSREFEAMPCLAYLATGVMVEFAAGVWWSRIWHLEIVFLLTLVFPLP